MVPPSLFAGLFPVAKGKPLDIFASSKKFKSKVRSKPDVLLAAAVQAASQADTAAAVPEGKPAASKASGSKQLSKGRPTSAAVATGEPAAEAAASSIPLQQDKAAKKPGKGAALKRPSPESASEGKAKGSSSSRPASSGNGSLPKKARRKEEVLAVITPAIQEAAAAQAGPKAPDAETCTAGDADAAPGASTQPEAVERKIDAALHRTVFVGNLPASASRKSLKRLFSRLLRSLEDWGKEVPPQTLATQAARLTHLRLVIPASRCSCGAVESVRLRSLAIKQDLKMPRKSALLAGELDKDRASGHAYVVFEDEASLPAALALNMMEHEGRHLRVDRAAANRSVQSAGGGPSVSKEEGVVYDPTRSVFAGNLPRSVEDEDVIRFFSDGSISSELRTGIEAVRVVRDRKTTLGKGIAFILYKTRSAARSAVLLDGHELGGRKIRVTRVKASAVGAGASAWQGATAGPKRRGVAAAGVAARSAKGPAKKLKRASEGKRPAVAARKARTLAKAARRA
ncbi:hypothetical protein ACKKBG_A33070 [Auxenochlorella protothecoides x Auxenochlorella symbiontica]